MSLPLLNVRAASRQPAPRLFIAGLSGGSGKTTLSLGLIAAWRRQGKSIAPYKKGPDYIDAGWLALAAGRPCYNLDTFLVSPDRVLSSFITHRQPEDIAVIEGNRGLYDGIDTSGTTSSAEVAKLLKCPVILSLDCTKATRTLAAVLNGCRHFDAAVDLRGIVLNRIAGSRHESILRQNIDCHCGIPVVGAVPKLGTQHYPERHMGLVPTPEHGWAQESIDASAAMAARYLDLDALERIAREAGPLQADHRSPDGPPADASVAPTGTAESNGPPPKIGIIRDAAFQFYYPDNIDALIAAGADIRYLNAFEDRDIGDLDALYIGGGFPETHAANLAENRSFLRAVRQAAAANMPIYAECGGLMYLGDAIHYNGSRYPMTGVFPAEFGLADRPQGLGYTIVRVVGENPFYPVGMEIRGHEFRYSQVLEWGGNAGSFVFSMERGKGFAGGWDGLSVNRVLATYTHIHAAGLPRWAESMVSNARRFQQGG